MQSSWTSQLKTALIKFVPPFLIAMVFAVIAGTSGALYSRTRDESRHLIRGVMLLETGDFRLNKHHPLFANVLNALPLMFIDDINIPSTESTEWKNAEKDRLAAMFTELNSPRAWFVPHILNPARTVTVFCVALSIIMMYFAVSRQWGLVSAVIFSGLYALEPNLIAHSSLVTTDGWIVPMIFGATLFLYKYAQNHKTTDLLLFAVLAFLSLITKYSAIPIAALWILLLFIIEWQHSGPKRRFFSSLKKPLFTILIWLFGLTAAYGFQFKSLAETNYENTAKTQSHIDNISGLTKSAVFLRKPLQDAYLYLKVPFSEYIYGFYENVILHNEYGHDTYLFGMYSKKGWWYYFPAAMAVKTPVPLLIGISGLTLFAAVSLMKATKQTISKKPTLKSLLKNIRLQPYHILILVPSFLIFLAMKSNINLGYRHILPILPFLFLGFSIYIPRLWKKNFVTKIALSILALWYVLSAVFIYPHYLSYFNELVSGPANGYKYLLDSNLSWEQDLFRVDDYVRNLPEGTVYYRNPLSPKENGLVIIDVDLLMGRDVGKREKTAWLREPFLNGEIEPVDRIGYTYMVFDMGKLPK